MTSAASSKPLATFLLKVGWNQDLEGALGDIVGDVL